LIQGYLHSGRVLTKLGVNFCTLLWRIRVLRNFLRNYAKDEYIIDSKSQFL
jgi:hypothetical protein